MVGGRKIHQRASEFGSHSEGASIAFSNFLISACRIALFTTHPYLIHQGRGLQSDFGEKTRHGQRQASMVLVLSLVVGLEQGEGLSGCSGLGSPSGEEGQIK